MLWGMRPLQHKAAYDVAVDQVRRQIHSGLLMPLEKLPAERKLSDDFGISRVTLREALRVLEAEDYIRIRRGAHGGAFVSDEEQVTLLSRRRIAREPATAMRLLEFLCVNGLAAARFAAERRELPEMKRMRFALDLMEKAESPAALKQAETYLHLACADAAHNRLLRRAVEDALADLFLPYPEHPFAEWRGWMRGHHADLVAALDRRDAETAERAMGAIHALYWTQIRRLTRSAA